ncbi:MAG TPA: response regulator [Planctomycetaceae bacterium]|nr:response regulator [Planctomycetaceae bacterium]
MANILLVDDQLPAAQVLVTFLEKAGHKVVCVPNGVEALSKVLADLPDVVLLDMLMPEMDGPSFLEVVRSYLRLQSLPVVVYTGLTDSPMITRAQALKVNSILIKGKASFEDVLHAIEEAIVRMPG